MRQGFIAMAGMKNARVRTMYVEGKLKAEIVAEILAQRLSASVRIGCAASGVSQACVEESWLGGAGAAGASTACNACVTLVYAVAARCQEVLNDIQGPK